MSPRSEEYMEQARRRLATLGRLDPETDFEAAVSVAYYAVLNAARAALSERDAYSRTHHGTWHLVYEILVTAGNLEPSLLTRAQNLQTLREGGDYRAMTPSADEARDAVALAREFIAAVERRFG